MFRELDNGRNSQLRFLDLEASSQRLFSRVRVSPTKKEGGLFADLDLDKLRK